MLDLKRCPECAEYTDYKNKTCPYCGRAFEEKSAAPDSSVRTPVLTTEYKHQDSAPVPRPSPAAAPVLVMRRSPLIAAGFSIFFIGWGQWYNGKTWEGIRLVLVTIAAAFVFIVLALALLKTGLEILILAAYALAVIGIWGYGIIDAYKTAEKINRGDIVFTKKSVLFWFPVLVLVLNILVVMIIGISALGALYG